MPGRSPYEAVEAFLDPLRAALACVGPGHFDLSPNARRAVGEMATWTLNNGEPLPLGGQGAALSARMMFEVQDRGRSRGAERFKVSTRGYLYGIEIDGHEHICAHWHPDGSSAVTFPHWHLGEAALAESGVFMANAHIPSDRITFEYMVRWLIHAGLVPPTCDDWAERLRASEELFMAHRTWSTP